MLERQRDVLLSAPLLPGGKFDPALHPVRQPLRDACVGALLTLVLGGLTWCVHPSMCEVLWGLGAWACFPVTEWHCIPKYKSLSQGF